MKLHVLHSDDGSIIALAKIQVDDDHQLQGRPVAQQGQSVAEVEVPHALASLSLSEIIQRYKINRGS